MTTPPTDSKSKRPYRVLKLLKSQTPEDKPTWQDLGPFEASSDRQAITLAMGGDTKGGTYVAVARFNLHTVTVKPVQQTKLDWS